MASRGDLHDKHWIHVVLHFIFHIQLKCLAIIDPNRAPDLIRNNKFLLILAK